jgi:radical SAM protein with 4Fe4S-binding SPASM domain
MRPAMSMYDAHPVVMWEFTRACSLHCANCTIGATESRGKNELNTFEAYKTIDQIASLRPRELIITGGDPLQREDLPMIINYARQCGLDPALVLSPTSKLTPEAIGLLERTGLSRVVFSMDGSAHKVHEGVRGVLGTFAATLRTACGTGSMGIEIEVNTLVSRRNANDLEAIADLIRSIGIVRWNLYFMVPLGTSLAEMISADAEMLNADEAESLFAVIDDIRAREHFAVRVIEAPQYRRVRLQRALAARLENVTRAFALPSDLESYDAADINLMDGVMESALDGARGFVFISHSGDVRPSEFLLFSAGNLRYRPLDAIYSSSDLFVALRDPDNLKGKCARCEFRWICGGSRARAWAMKGNVFAEDPLCNYEPGVPLSLPMATYPQREI